MTKILNNVETTKNVLYIWMMAIISHWHSFCCCGKICFYYLSDEQERVAGQSACTSAARNVMFMFFRCTLIFFSAHKRSLRRLCFHRCLSVRGGGSRSLSRGVSVPGGGGGGSPSQGALCPGGSLSGVVSVMEIPHTVTSGQYASYWNAFFFTITCLHLMFVCMFGANLINSTHFLSMSKID